MALLIISREFPPQDGGIASVAYQMAHALTQKGETPVVLTWAYPAEKGPSDFEDEKQPFEIKRLKKSWNRWGQIAQLYFAGSKLILQKKIKRIYATTWNFSGVAAALLSKQYSIPYAVMTYGYDVAPEALGFSDRFLMRYALTHSRKIFTCSRYTRDLMLQHHKISNTEFLPLGVNSRFFRPDIDGWAVRKRFGLEGKKVLLTVARLYPRKGHDQVLKALAKVVKAFPDVFYLIVGQGGEAVNLKALVKDSGLSQHVAFAGFVPDEELSAYYAACDIFILANREIKNKEEAWKGDFEGFGLVFLEASATAKPVIGGKSGGVEDAVKDGETGLLVNSLDADSIASALRELLSDETLAKKMGQAGRKWVEDELDWNILIQKYEKAFETI